MTPNNKNDRHFGAEDSLVKKRSVITNIINRVLAYAGNLIIVIFVATKLGPEMRGFYYAFYSLTFLKFFADLGLGFATVQIVSHKSETHGDLVGSSYANFFIRLYLVSSVVLVIVLCPSILLFVDQAIQVSNYQSRIFYPWIALSLFTSAGIIINGAISVVEGKLKILEASRLRLVYSVSNVAGVVMGLLAGMELWSLALGSAVSVAIVGYRLIDYRDYFLVPASLKGQPIDWRREIWPFQWRIGVSWISGFFIFYILTPLVLKYDGAVNAGRYGMSVQIIQAINSISIIFVSTHSAKYGKCVASGEARRMDAEYFSDLKKSNIALVGLLSGGFAVQLFADKIAERPIHQVLDIDLLLVLGGACLCNHVFYLTNYYLRSYKEESLWLISLLCGLTTFFLALRLIPSGGVVAAVWIYFVCSLVYWCILGLPYFLRRRRYLLNRYANRKN